MRLPFLGMSPLQVRSDARTVPGSSGFVWASGVVGAQAGSRTIALQPTRPVRDSARAVAYGFVGRAMMGMLVLSIALASFFVIRWNTVPAISAQDEGALYYGAHTFLETGAVRAVNPLGVQRHSGVIGNLYTAYRGNDRFYRAFPGAVLLDAGLIAIGGDSLFWSSDALFGALAVVGVFLVSFRITRSAIGAAFAAVLLATSPAFAHWAVSYFNNVPALACEVFALFFLLRQERLRPVDLLLAGCCTGASIFLRSTEILVALPFAVMAILRSRPRVQGLWFVAPVAGFLAALAFVNTMFYGSPWFQPHLAPTYVPPGVQPTGPGTIERYALFLLGAQGSIFDARPWSLPGHYLFHIRYFVGSSFAFPFLIPVLLGASFGVARGWRELRVVGAMALSILAITVIFYGNQENNYYGYGLDSVRSSFVRYLLLEYALLAVTGGVVFSRACAWLGQKRVAGGWSLVSGKLPLARSLAAACIVAGVGALGWHEAQDPNRYGLDRLNAYRESSINESQALNGVLRDVPAGGDALILVGFTTGKLVDLRAYPNVIDYSEVPAERWPADVVSVASLELSTRPVVILATPTSREDREMIALLRASGMSMKEHSIGYDAVFVATPETDRG